MNGGAKCGLSALAFIVVGCSSGTAPTAAKQIMPVHPTAERASSRTVSAKKPDVEKATPKVNPPIPISDSSLSLEAALEGCKCPDEVKADESLVEVRYYSFDGLIHSGRLVVNRSLAKEVKDIFDEILNSRFPIRQIKPISEYGWSDEASMADDNTSGFNYRQVPATGRLSNHSSGHAIDINPVENPYMDPVHGSRYTYDPSVPGTITRDSAVYKAFHRRGWTWGGLWRRSKDFQHFEKIQ